MKTSNQEHHWRKRKALIRSRELDSIPVGKQWRSISLWTSSKRFFAAFMLFLASVEVSLVILIRIIAIRETSCVRHMKIILIQWSRESPITLLIILATQISSYGNWSEREKECLTLAQRVPWSGDTAPAAWDCSLIAVSREGGNGGAIGITVLVSTGEVADFVVSEMMIGIGTSRTSLVVISIETCRALCGSSISSGLSRISWSMSVTRSASSLW